MNRTFLLSHLVAWLAAVVFGLVSAAVLLAFPPYLTPYFFPRAIIPTAVAILIMWRVAIILGPYDLLAILSGILSATLSFSIRYELSIQAFLPDDGHTMYDILMDGAHPFHFWDQARLFTNFLVWSLMVTGIGIALKRGLAVPAANSSSPPSAPGSRETLKIVGWLTLDTVLIFCVTFAILWTQATNRQAQGKPAYLAQTLLSPQSSEAERMKAIWDLSMAQTPESTQALRTAAAQSPPPLNILAAGTLLERNDISALPVVEDVCLNHPSQLDEAPGHGAIDLENDLDCIKDPAALPTLVRLMASPDVGTRRGAAHALFNIGSPSAVPVYIQGLNNNDSQVRFWSVRGLAKTTLPYDKTWDCFLGGYLQNESFYLNHWKAWAKARTQAGP